MGSVFDASFLDVTAAKLQYAIDRDPVCKTCNLDPLNKLVEAHRARDAGDADAPDVGQMLEKLRGFSAFALDEIAALTGRSAPPAKVNGSAVRRTIPVTAI